MKIYILQKETRYDYESENELKVFRTLEDAKAEFKEMTRVYREDAINDEWEIDADTEMSFEAYEEGYECQNHYYFNILTFDV